MFWVSNIIYHIAKMYRPSRTSAWFSWDWLEYLHNRNTPGSVDMQHLCTSGYIPCDAIMVANMTVYLQQLLTTAPSSFSFIYLTRADMTGHNHGWCTPEYLSAVADTDKLVGQILDAVETAKAEVKMPQMLLLSILSRKYSWKYAIKQFWVIKVNMPLINQDLFLHNVIARSCTSLTRYLDRVLNRYLDPEDAPVHVGYSLTLFNKTKSLV